MKGYKVGCLGLDNMAKIPGYQKLWSSSISSIPGFQKLWFSKISRISGFQSEQMIIRESQDDQASLRMISSQETNHPEISAGLSGAF